MKRSKGFTLIELMIVIAIIAIIAAIAVPGILAAIRVANERNASASLKQLGSVEITFKTSDTDGNAISDYWVADIAGLYYASPVAPAPGPDALAKLIELPMAQADGNTAAAYAVPGGGAHLSQPKSGYWFFALTDFLDGSGAAAVSTYAANPVDRFGFTAVPNSYGSSGKLVFILSEGNTMYKRDPTASTGAGGYFSAVPSTAVQDTDGVLSDAYNTFPIDPNAAGQATCAGPWSTVQ
jgi:type IV pilus assembly protein PilA